MTWRGAALALLAFGAGAGPAAGITLQARVLEVIDGDTVRVEARGFDTLVRLIGIDTPETRKPATPVQCWGPEASAAAAALLPRGRRVSVVTDPTQATRDRYGRLLGYVYRGGIGPSRSVNYILVAGGHAKVYVYGGRPFQHVRQFRGAQLAARAEPRGLWGEPCFGNTTQAQPKPVAPPPTPAAPPSGAPLPAPPPPSQGPVAPSCDPNYSGACIPVYPPDVDCSQISARRFRVVGTDVHRLDADGDGVACES